MSKEEKESVIKIVNRYEDDDCLLSREDFEEWNFLKLEEIQLAAEAQGRIEGIEQITIEHAEKMLKENIEVSLISKITGLTEEEIIKIKNK